MPEWEACPNGGLLTYLCIWVFGGGRGREGEGKERKREKEIWDGIKRDKRVVDRLNGKGWV